MREVQALRTRPQLRVGWPQGPGGALRIAHDEHGTARLVLLQPHMRPAEGDVIAHRFQLIRELGQGSMGSVWLAHHLTLEVRCAVKFIAGEALSDPKYLAQFHVEARTIAQVKSPHVVRVLDHDVCGETPYIAMEFLEGEDLRTRLQRARRLDSLATHAIVSQIARGLSKAHAAGIVHRDLKPENVFLAEEDGETVVKLLDFGVAKWAASRHGASGGSTEGLVGTPEYMSPEQAQGMVAIDHRADLWALAVIAFECLTGRLPFEAPTMSELLGRITASAPPVPSETVQDLPPEVDGWWAHAVSRSIDARFQSARELALALGGALSIAEPVAATTLPPHRESVSWPPVVQTPPDAWLSGRLDGSAQRLRRFGYPLAAAGLMVALVLPLAEGSYGGAALTSDARAPTGPGIRGGDGPGAAREAGPDGSRTDAANPHQTGAAGSEASPTPCGSSAGARPHPTETEGRP